MGHEGHEDRGSHKAHEEGRTVLESLARNVVDAGLAVHKALGPGLLESTYEQCLAHEFNLRGMACQRQVVLPLTYKGMTLDGGYRLDIVVENAILIEIKSVEALGAIHEAQILTYLRFSGHKIGFLMNFKVTLYKQGLRRFIL